MKRFAAAMFCVVLAAPLFAAPAPKEKEKQDVGFIRTQTDKGKVTSLQTAVVTYKKGDVTVDLVGVIHVGDKTYYKGLQARMAAHDALLYELVAPKGAVPERKASMMGMIVKAVADLDMQLACINYKKPNFVHADLSFAEMKQEMDKRGEDTLTIALNLLVEMLSKDKKADADGLAQELAQADTPITLKRVFARMLVGQMADAKGGIMERLLIKDRNKKTMEVLGQQMKAGKKKLGIFYGAAHMPDFEARLKALGFERTTTTWHTAWDLDDDD